MIDWLWIARKSNKSKVWAAGAAISKPSMHITRTSVHSNEDPCCVSKGTVSQSRGMRYTWIVDAHAKTLVIHASSALSSQFADQLKVVSSTWSEPLAPIDAVALRWSDDKREIFPSHRRSKRTDDSTCCDRRLRNVYVRTSCEWGNSFHEFQLAC